MRYQFIQHEQRVYSPTLLGRVLQVSRSGYYAFLQRAEPLEALTDARVLLAEVQQMAHASHSTCGSRQIKIELQASGYLVGRYRTRMLMRNAQVTVPRRKRWTTTIQSQHAHPIARWLGDRLYSYLITPPDLGHDWGDPEPKYDSADSNPEIEIRESAQEALRWVADH